MAVAILGFAGGCGDDGTGCETKGDLCTVVLQQGGDSEAEAFGYRVRLVSITDETVTVTVDDEPFRVSNAHPGRLAAAFALELRLKEKASADGRVVLVINVKSD